MGVQNSKNKNTSLKTSMKTDDGIERVPILRTMNYEKRIESM